MAFELSKCMVEEYLCALISIYPLYPVSMHTYISLVCLKICNVMCFQICGVAVQITNNIDLMHRKSLLPGLY